MIKVIKNLYLNPRFFAAFGIVIVLFAASFAYGFLMAVAQTVLLLMISILTLDLILLFGKRDYVTATRVVPKVLSLGSENNIRVEIESKLFFQIYLKLIDELPFQLQKRDFEIGFWVLPGEKKVVTYPVVPPVRGEYNFGRVNVFISTQIRLIERRVVFPLETQVAVYPSIILMKKFELKAFDKISLQQGVKRIRRIGTSSEFDQIKNYVKGDNYQSINWKATSRRNSLMVNHYEDEKAQNIYCIIDKSRIMKMPFNGLSLLDHSINTALVISNIALKKNDRAGLIAFGDKIGIALKADNSRNHLKVILESLYKEKEGNLEANYELLYTVTRNFIKGRSLMFLFTNFESLFGLERVLPVLRKLNKLHLLVVVFFENTELDQYSKHTAFSMEEIYNKSIAQKFLLEKQQIIYSLKQYGIQSILTKPEDLPLNTLNKYLELKSRGLI